MCGWALQRERPTHCNYQWITYHACINISHCGYTCTPTPISIALMHQHLFGSIFRYDVCFLGRWISFFYVQDSVAFVTIWTFLKSYGTMHYVVAAMQRCINSCPRQCVLRGKDDTAWHPLQSWSFILHKVSSMRCFCSQGIWAADCELQVIEYMPASWQPPQQIDSHQIDQGWEWLCMLMCDDADLHSFLSQSYISMFCFVLAVCHILNS
jgi:hypothetical protein